MFAKDATPEQISAMFYAKPPIHDILERLKNRPPTGEAPRPERWGGEDPSLPSVVTQVGNYAAATGRYLASGLRQAPANVVEDRLAICRQCEHLRASDDKCSQCGCPVMAKAQRAAESCPVGRWVAIAGSGKCGCGGPG